MTDLEHADISRRLALAIGWEKWRVMSYRDAASIWIGVEACGWWKRFDYRDPAVIWPIAERFDCFPHQRENMKWNAWVFDDEACSGYESGKCDTAALAVALAVIKAKEQQ
jgi:hypothetical protein